MAPDDDVVGDVERPNIDLRRMIAIHGADTTGVASREELKTVLERSRRAAAGVGFPAQVAGAAQSSGSQAHAPISGTASEPAPEPGAGGEPSGIEAVSYTHLTLPTKRIV